MLTTSDDDQMKMKGIEIKERREALGLSQSELAAMLGLSLRTVQNYEAGTQIPRSRVEMLRKFVSGELDNQTSEVAVLYLSLILTARSEG